MTRICALLMLLAATPAAAWEARAGAVCELFHEGAAGEVLVTYDAAIPQYAITIRPAAAAWPEGPIFVMRFDGPSALTIQTDRHSITEGGAALTVRDRGFGNVLNGLEFNETATAYLGDLAVPFGLTGPEPAAPAVAAFRACTESGLV